MKIKGPLVAPLQGRVGRLSSPRALLAWAGELGVGTRELRDGRASLGPVQASTGLARAILGRAAREQGHGAACRHAV
jgi:hypothetical protein